MTATLHRLPVAPDETRARLTAAGYTVRAVALSYDRQGTGFGYVRHVLLDGDRDPYEAALLLSDGGEPRPIGGEGSGVWECTCAGTRTVVSTPTDPESAA